MSGNRNFRVRRRNKDTYLAAGTQRSDGSVELICAGIWREAPDLETALPDLEALSSTGVEVEWEDG